MPPKGSKNQYELKDLKSDDDFCIALLVDHLTKTPLGTHYSTPDYEPPFNKQRSSVLKIIQQEVQARGDITEAYRVLTSLDVVRKHLEGKSTPALELFESQARLYLALYLSTNPLELGKTSRYTHITGKLELGIFAAKKIAKHTDLQSHLAGNMAPYTDEDEDSDAAALEAEASDEEPESSAAGAARGARPRKPDLKARRDFSIVTSWKTGRQSFFLGPGRFLNHDCDPNVELKPGSGNTITFRTLKAIKAGDELTCFYDKAYFGHDNQDCLCSTCERKHMGWYAGKTKPSLSSLPLSVDSPASDFSFTTASSTLASSTSKLCLSASAAINPSSSHAIDAPDSEPGTPSSSSSEELPPPDVVVARHLRSKAAGGLEGPGDDLTVRWGDVEVRERRCTTCKGSVELELRGGDWVQKERCFHCDRHRAIFFPHPWPDRPDPKKSNPHWDPKRPQKLSARVDSAWPNFDREHRTGMGQRNTDLASKLYVDDNQKQQLELQRREREARSYRLNPFADEDSPYDYIDTTIKNLRLVRTMNKSPEEVRLDGFTQLVQLHQPGRIRPSWLNTFPRSDYREYKHGDKSLHGGWINLDYAIRLACKGKIYPLVARFLQKHPDFTYPVRQSWKLPLGPAPSEVIVHPQLPAEVYDLYDHTLEVPDAFSHRYPVPKVAERIRGKLPSSLLAQPLDATTADILIPYETHYDEEKSVVHVEVRGAITGGQTVTVGRMPNNHNWINLTAILCMIGLDLNERNSVYSTIRSEKKQLYSLPHGSGPPADWEGVWSDLGTVRKICDHFGVSYIFTNLFLKSSELNNLLDSLELSEDVADKPSGSSSSNALALRPSPRKNALLSSPKAARTPSKMATGANADDADDEEEDEAEVDDFDLALLDSPPMDGAGREALPKIEDDFDDDFGLLDDDKMVVDAPLHPNRALSHSPERDRSSAAQIASSSKVVPVERISVVVIELNSDDDVLMDEEEDDDDDDDVRYIEPAIIPYDNSDDDSDIQCISNPADPKGKGKAVDRSHRPKATPPRRIHPFFDNPPPDAEASSSNFYAKRPIVPPADQRPKRKASIPSSSPAAKVSEVIEISSESDDDGVRMPAKKSRSDNPPRAGPSQARPKLSPAKIPSPVSSASSRDVIDLTMNSDDDV